MLASWSKLSEKLWNAFKILVGQAVLDQNKLKILVGQAVLELLIKKILSMLQSITKEQCGLLTFLNSSYNLLQDAYYFSRKC